MYILPQLEKKIKGLPLSAGVQGNHLVLSFIWPTSHKLGFHEFSDGFCTTLSSSLRPIERFQPKESLIIATLEESGMFQRHIKEEEAVNSN